MSGEVIYPGLPPILLNRKETIKFELSDDFSHRFEGTTDGIKYCLNVPNSKKNSDLSPSQWTNLSLRRSSEFEKQALIFPGILVRAISDDQATKVETLFIKI